MWDGGHQLRKVDFPECTEKALRQLKTMFTRDNSNIPGLGSVSEETISQIVEDFVFGKPRGKASRMPGAIVELHILDSVINLYRELAAEETSDIVSFSIFQALFGKVGQSMERVHTLSKLISLAINVENRLLLDSAAMWMQLQGMQSTSIHLIMDSLMRDFGSLSSEARKRLSHLPKMSEHFCCIFVSGITSMCKYPGSPLSAQSRPFYSLLLPLLTEWITADSHLCLISLLQAQRTQSFQTQRSSLWTSPTKPNTHTPIPGLIRWTTQGALRNVHSSPAAALKFSEQTNASAVKENYSNEVKESDLDLLWSRLHLGILQTLAVFPTIPGAAQLEVITLADMKKLVDELVILLVQGFEEKDAAHGIARDTAEDRMLQLIQVALATGAFRCSLADLRIICLSLPETKLRNILESQHLSNNPPAMHNAS